MIPLNRHVFCKSNDMKELIFRKFFIDAIILF